MYSVSVLERFYCISVCNICLFKAAVDLVRTRAITNNTQGNDDFVKSLSRTLLRIKSSIDTCEVDIRDNWWKTEWKKEVQAYLDETDAESISKFS